MLLLFLSIGSFLVLLPKFEFLQKQLASKLVYFLDDLFIADLQVGKINFKSYDNIQIDDILVYTKGDTLAYIPKIKLEFGLRQLFLNNVYVKKLQIYNSKFKLLRLKDSTWNYEYIVESSSEDTSSSKTPFLNLKNIELINCTFRFLDSTKDNKIIDNQLNYSNLWLNKINFKADAELDIDKKIHYYYLQKLSFNEVNTGLVVNSLNADKISFLKDKSIVENMNLVVNNSKIKVEAEANGFSPINFNYEDLFTMKSNTKISSPNFNTKNLYFFADSIVKFPRDYEVDFVANGNLSSAIVNDIHIKGKGINLKGSCIVKDYTDPDKLSYNANVANSNIDISEVRKVLVYDLDAVPEIGLVFVNNFEGNGNLRDYFAKFDLVSKVGNVKGEASLNLPNEKYMTKSEFGNFNLHTLLPGTYVTNLNGKIDLEAQNFDISKLNGLVEIQLKNSTFENKNMDSVNFKAKVDNGKFDIKDFTYNTSNSLAKVTGYLDISNLEKAIYDLEINTNNLDLTFLNTSLPSQLTSNVKVNGEGLDIEKIKLSSKIKIQDLIINNSLIKNFDFNLLVDNSVRKNIKIESDDVSIIVDGDFSIFEMIDVLNNEFEYLYHSIEIVSNHFNHHDSNEVVKLLDKYPKMDAKIEFDINSIKKFREFIPLDLNFNTKFNLSLKSIESVFQVTIDKINMKNFKIRENDFQVSSDQINILLDYKRNLSLENPLEKLNVGLNTELLKYNDLKINKLDYLFDINNNVITSKIDSRIMDSLQLSNVLTIKTPNPNNYVVSISKLDFTFGSYNRYFNDKPINIFLIDSILKTNDFRITSDKQEMFDVNIDYNFNSKFINNFDFTFNNLDFSKLKQFVHNEYLNTLEGSLDSIKLNISRNLSNPEANLSLNGKTIKYSNVNIGKIDANFNFSRNNLFGNFKIGENNKLFNIKSNQIPLIVNLEDFDIKFDENKDFDIEIDLNNLDAGLAEPFLPVIYNVKGDVNSKINIKGSLNKGINYSGEMKVENGSFIVEPTNMMYDIESIIDIKNDLFTLRNTKVKNKPQDLKNGVADIQGYLKMKGFSFDDFEFEIKSSKFKVMREETRLVSPDLFGDMIIANGKKPLIFSGNFDYPKLSGDIDILSSKLSMPNEVASQIIESKLRYKVVDNVIKVTIDESKDSLESDKTEINENFLDILAMDLNIRFIEDLEMYIELNALTDMKVFLGTKYKEDVVVFKKARKEDAKLVGSIFLRNNSYLTFLGKRFSTSGEVSFPTGEISNPTLNIVSRYTNYTPKGNPFEVLIDLKGTKNQPILDFSYIYNNLKATEDKKEMEQNAFSLLALNMLKDDALGSDQASNSNLQGEAVNIGNSILSNLATKNINEALIEYGVSANVDIDINNPDQSVVKLQGKLFNIVKWSVGGNISNIENNQVAIEIPLSYYSILQFSKPNNPFIIKDNQVLGEIKLRFGTTW